MPPLQGDPTVPVLTWVFSYSVVWILAACLWRAIKNGGLRALPAPMPPQPGISVEPYRVWDLAVVFLLFTLFMSPLLMAGGAEKPPQTLKSAHIITTIMMLFLLAGFATSVVAWRVPPADWLGLRWKNWRSLFWMAPLSVAAMWGVFAVLMTMGYMRWMESLGVETVQESVRTLQDSHDPALIASMAFAALVAAPVCEEVIFRGYCHGVLKKYAGTGTSMVTTSLVFACAHGNLASALPLFLLGMLLVWTYEKTRSLWAPIAIHFLFNTATVVTQILVRWLDIPLGPS